MLAPAPRDPAAERLSEAARFHDYRYASNPIADGTLPKIPGARFAAALHEQGVTRTIPLDLSSQLACPGPATTPGLCASFVHVCDGDAHITDANATSQLFFVMRGAGSTRIDGQADFEWQAGDLFTLPAQSRALHAATADAALYWVHDEPLLRYLGATATQRQFPPTLFKREEIHKALEAVIRDPSSATANRVSILLGSRVFPQTMTITHVMWAMFGILPVNAVQAPHRHQSVAVDLVVDAKPGCYTMVGKSLDADGRVEPLDPSAPDRRQDLEPLRLPDGGVIAVRRELLERGPHPHAFLGRDRRGIVTAPGDVVDVDDAADLAVADARLRNAGR